jgi:hypothetical protein
MCGSSIDRSCWVFMLQACLSIMVMAGAFVFLLYDKEKEWAKNILIMILSVWFPAPKVNLVGTFHRPKDESLPEKEKGPGHSSRESGVPWAVQRPPSRTHADREGEDEKDALRKQPGLVT